MVNGQYSDRTHVFVNIRCAISDKDIYNSQGTPGPHIESRSCGRIWDTQAWVDSQGMLLHLACRSVANTKSHWFPGPGHMPLLALSLWRLKVVDDQTQTLRTRRHETSKLLLTRGDPFAPPWLL